MFRASFQLILFSMIGISCCYRDTYWWDSALVYNVFPKSFKDSNNDGTGDLRGILEKLQYIKNLGADAIYLNPFFKSPMVDTGYDISDFESVDPLFGSMEDLDDLIAECKRLGLKFIIDFVPNHTSDKHKWFQKSIKKIQPYTDYYVWKDALGFNGNGTPIPPNAWSCAFGGSSWEWNTERQQFYYHAFYKNQPDLNYLNENVVEESKNILRFWLNKRIDGVRIDAIQFLLGNFTCVGSSLWALECRVDQPEIYKYLKIWRETFEEFSAASDNQRRMIMIEFFPIGGGDSSQKQLKYHESGADVVYNFILSYGKAELNATYLYNKIDKYTTQWMRRNYTMNWLIGIHDQPRQATLLGEEMADSFSMIMLLLPGNVFVYNGLELGMNDYEHMPLKIDWRDAFRTPFQWDDSPQAGFSRLKTTWLPTNPNYYRKNVKTEEKDPKSQLNFYKKLIKIRKSSQIRTGNMELYQVSESVLALSRFAANTEDQKFLVLVNAGSELECISLEESIPNISKNMFVQLPTINSEHEEGERTNLTGCFSMRPKSAVLLASGTSGTAGTVGAATVLPSLLLLALLLVKIFN